MNPFRQVDQRLFFLANSLIILDHPCSPSIHRDSIQPWHSACYTTYRILWRNEYNMRKISPAPINTDPIILAPEGFIDEQHWAAVAHRRVSVIEYRTLSDLPIFHTIHIEPRSNPHQTED